MSTLFSILGVRMIVGVFMALVPIALLIVLQVWQIGRASCRERV